MCELETTQVELGLFLWDGRVRYLLVRVQGFLTITLDIGIAGLGYRKFISHSSGMKAPFKCGVSVHDWQSVAAQSKYSPLYSLE